MTETVRLTLEEVRDLAERGLSAHGFSKPHAEAIAETMTAAERDGSHHHGLFRMAFYGAARARGLASADAEPVIEDLAPAVIRCDARLGFAPLALARGAEPLAARARSQGIAALAVNNCFHVGPLWIEVERLAAQGLAVVAVTAAIPYVAPHGGTRPVFGTNPMAFGWPRADRPPYVFDQASSVSARGSIQLALRDGRPIPEGWAIDADGRPTTDPTAALSGAQLPFGGAKGSALATMVELLAGPLLGDLLSLEAGERDTGKTGAPCGGELLIAMDLSRFSPGADPAARMAHAERLFEAILAQDGTRLPGDRRYAAREKALANGVDVPRALVEEIEAKVAGAASGPKKPWEGDPAG